MKINQSRYKFSHGKSPRGYGAFAFAVTPGAPIEAVFIATGTYTEAKSQAVAHFRATGASEIFVLP